MKLYEIASEFNELEQLYDLEDEEIQGKLTNLKGELEYKCTNVAFFERNIENTIEGIKEAQRNMAARRKALENKAARIRDYLKTNMEECGIERIETPHFVISIAKNPPAVEIKDETMIPDEFKSEVTIIKIDKSALKDFLKKNGGIPGAELVQGTRLKIK